LKGRQAIIRLLAGLVTLAILVAIYIHIDMGSMVQRLRHAHLGFFALAVSLFIPQVLVACLRWQFMMRGIRHFSLAESLHMVMASKALNALVPSKLGEMSKAFFLKQDGRVDSVQSVSAVLMEKLFDMGGLCSMLLAGCLFNPETNKTIWVLATTISGSALAIVGLVFVLPMRSLGQRLAMWGGGWVRVSLILSGWETVISLWRLRKGTLPLLVGLTALLSSLHVMQIYLFFPALRHPVPLGPALMNIPLGLIAGLLPITIAGMGTRDSALIVLFAPYADASVVAGVGLLCSLRYWVDTFLGVPFFHRYTSRMGQAPQKVEQAFRADQGQM
jgi:glycosyltransferase 2 family protein